MKRIALVILVALAISGCSGSMIRVDAIDGLVEKVSARHDGYVASDPALTDDQKATALRSTALLRAVIAEAKGGGQ